MAGIRARYRHQGPPLSVEDMDEAVARMFRDSQD